MKEALNHTISSFETQVKDVLEQNNIAKERMIEINSIWRDVIEKLDKNFIEMTDNIVNTFCFNKLVFSSKQTANSTVQLLQESIKLSETI